MTKNELYNFGNYEIYGVENGKKILLCVCENYNVARNIAIMMARLDKDHCHYFVRIILENPDDFVCGGGSYDEYWYDSDGKGHHIQLS